MRRQVTLKKRLSKSKERKSTQNTINTEMSAEDENYQKQLQIKKKKMMRFVSITKN